MRCSRGDLCSARHAVEAVFQGISARAGHGLTYEKIKKIIHINNLEELNIGHFIIGEAIFYGLEKVVKQMKKIISKGLQ